VSNAGFKDSKADYETRELPAHQKQASQGSARRNVKSASRCAREWPVIREGVAAREFLPLGSPGQNGKLDSEWNSASCDTLSPSLKNKTWRAQPRGFTFRSRR